MHKNILHEWLKLKSQSFHPVVSFDPAKEKLVRFDFTETNKALQKIDLLDTKKFSEYITSFLQNAKAKFGIGGYNELRTLYARSSLFGSDSIEQEEPRRLHLGVDIWGKAGTKIFAPLNSVVQSFAFNDNFGDYGATIILLHQQEEMQFFTLYGHLSYADLQNIHEGDYIECGEQFAHFGNSEENGHWPPHLHFQVIDDIENYKGDYPGVCKFSERKKYLLNCPDPDLVLNMMQYVIR